MGVCSCDNTKVQSLNMALPSVLCFQPHLSPYVISWTGVEGWLPFAIIIFNTRKYWKYIYLVMEEYKFFIINLSFQHALSDNVVQTQSELYIWRLDYPYPNNNGPTHRNIGIWSHQLTDWLTSRHVSGLVILYNVGRLDLRHNITGKTLFFTQLI